MTRRPLTVVAASETGMSRWTELSYVALAWLFLSRDHQLCVALHTRCLQVPVSG